MVVRSIEVFFHLDTDRATVECLVLSAIILLSTYCDETQHSDIL